MATPEETEKLIQAAMPLVKRTLESAKPETVSAIGALGKAILDLLHPKVETPIQKLPADWKPESKKKEKKKKKNK